MPDGSIKILRMQVTRLDETNEIIEKTIEHTIIQAKEFNLICGTCQNVVIYRQQPVMQLPQPSILTTWGTMIQYYETKVSL
jgi:hypothetical protein